MHEHAATVRDKTQRPSFPSVQSPSLLQGPVPMRPHDWCGGGIMIGQDAAVGRCTAGTRTGAGDVPAEPPEPVPEPAPPVEPALPVEPPEPLEPAEPEASESGPRSRPTRPQARTNTPQRSHLAAGRMPVILRKERAALDDGRKHAGGDERVEELRAVRQRCLRFGSALGSSQVPPEPNR